VDLDLIELDAVGRGLPLNRLLRRSRYDVSLRAAHPVRTRRLSIAIDHLEELVAAVQPGLSIARSTCCRRLS